jgi:hypothetical protein
VLLAGSTWIRIIWDADQHRSKKSEAVDANSEDVKAHPGVIEAHNGAVGSPGALEDQ